jgi:hypothetical protein
MGLYGCELFVGVYECVFMCVYKCVFIGVYESVFSVVHLYLLF